MFNDLSFWQWVFIFLIFFGTSIIQGAIGFASALIAIPLILSVGVDLPEVLVMMGIVAGFQCFSGWWGLREHLDYKETVFPIGMRLLFVPVGVGLMTLLNSQFSKEEMKIFIGAIVLFTVILLLVCRIKPQKSIPKWATGTAFGISGFMQGLVGMAGPPTVLWVMALDWDSKKTRSFLLFTLLAAIPVQLTSLYWTHSASFTAACMKGLVAIPVVVVGVIVGVRIGGFISKPKLRMISYGILIVNALWNVAGPFVKSNPMSTEEQIEKIQKLNSEVQ